MMKMYSELSSKLSGMLSKIAGHFNLFQFKSAISLTEKLLEHPMMIKQRQLKLQLNEKNKKFKEKQKIRSPAAFRFAQDICEEGIQIGHNKNFKIKQKIKNKT